ncbi:hypothetical protein HY488_02720 [Candidatus Woesearchaeota archaeon]|nr:hypothetical protein [Candidatus Woesearchaeota archaeon]
MVCIAVKLVSQPEYQIERKGFEDIVFTASSQEYLAWPAAVAFAKERNAVLQSAREAAAFRIEADGQDDDNLYQPTRTVVAYFRDGNKWYAAVDDVADPKRNIVLARADEGYKAHKAHNKWVLPKRDGYVRSLLDRATKNERVFSVGEQSPLELVTKPQMGKSPFVANDGIKAILGDTSKNYARFLAKKGHPQVYFFQLTPETLERFELSNDNVEVRLVGLGFDCLDDIEDVDADYHCDNHVGCARGVRSVEPTKRTR